MGSRKDRCKVTRDDIRNGDNSNKGVLTWQDSRHELKDYALGFMRGPMEYVCQGLGLGFGTKKSRQNLTH